MTSDKSKWTRCAVLQYDTLTTVSTNNTKWTLAKSRIPSVNKDFASDGTKSPFRTDTLSRGMSWFPGYAIDLDRGVRLNLMFAESQSDDTSRKGNDLIWEPRVGFGRATGTKSFIYVMNTTYDEGKEIEKKLDEMYFIYGRALANGGESPDNFLKRVRTWNLQNIMYFGLMGRQIDFVNAREVPMNISPVRIKLRVQREFLPYNQNSSASEGCNPLYEFEIKADDAGRFVSSIGKSAMDLIRVVPNPYLSISGYENSQIDSRVKIVNLPSKCVVSIFNLSGTLVRQFNFDQTSTKPYASNADGKLRINDRGSNFQTFVEWDLKNQLGIPIASGVYIIHVDSPDFGRKILKWFGVLRPIDLDTFN
jgi:hypothetical protein